MQDPRNPVLTIVLYAVAMAIIAGCSKSEMRMPMNDISSIQEKMTGRPYIILLYEQPDWLLIGGKDVADESSAGKVITVSGKHAYLDEQFQFINYEPGTSPLRLQVSGENRVVYWKGKGEIVNYEVHEKVLVPIRNAE
jgi:hypothetical protein